MTGPLRLLMLAACVVGGISLAVSLAVVASPDIASVPDVAVGKVIDAGSETAVAQDTAVTQGTAVSKGTAAIKDTAVTQGTAAIQDTAVTQHTAVSQDTAAGRDAAADRDIVPLETVVAGSDIVAPRNIIRRPISSPASRMKPTPYLDILEAHHESIAETPRPATTTGATTAQYIQEVPEEKVVSPIIRFKTSEPSDATPALASFPAGAAPIVAEQPAGERTPAKQREQASQLESVAQCDSTIRREPTKPHETPFRDKAIARPSMTKSAGSRANDGRNDGRVVQVQYQVPQYIVPRPAFGQQANPNAVSPAAPQTSTGSTQQSTSTNTSLPGAESNAGMPSTGDGISSGPQPPPSLNGPWAAGGIQPGTHNRKTIRPNPASACRRCRRRAKSPTNQRKPNPGRARRRPHPERRAPKSKPVKGTAISPFTFKIRICAKCWICSATKAGSTFWPATASREESPRRSPTSTSIPPWRRFSSPPDTPSGAKVNSSTSALPKTSKA